MPSGATIILVPLSLLEDFCFSSNDLSFFEGISCKVSSSYGLSIGGVLATDNAVIPYAVGVDIGCRMSLTLFDAKADCLKRYSHQIKGALKDYTHFGMDGGLPFVQEHEIIEREEFQLTPLLRDLQGKAIR